MKDKKYQIIYADPPWGHNDKMETHSFSQLNHYKTMTTREICNLPIKNITDKNCILFLWVVNPMLADALEVIKSWGFKYKTVGFCWNKISKHGKWISNLGRWTMGNMEICLIATKGKPKRIKKNIKQLVVSERKKHSEKPQEVRNRIVELMGELPRIELFARGDRQKDLLGYNRYDGWDMWGNEVVGDIQL